MFRDKMENWLRGLLGKPKPTKAELRDGMDSALKTYIVPLLRQTGFKGTYPHFRRRLHDRIDLLTFGFDKYGGGFYIEIAQCAPEGLTTSWGKHIEPSHVTAWDISKNRPRIIPGIGPSEAAWFRFDNGQFGKSVAQVQSLLPKAELWFEGREGL